MPQNSGASSEPCPCSRDSTLPQEEPVQQKGLKEKLPFLGLVVGSCPAGFSWLTLSELSWLCQGAAEITFVCAVCSLQGIPQPFKPPKSTEQIEHQATDQGLLASILTWRRTRGGSWCVFNPPNLEPLTAVPLILSLSD